LHLAIKGDIIMKNRAAKLGALAFLSVLLAVSLFAGSTQAITNGSPDDQKHPYVCIVVFYDSSGNSLWYTTGVLISSNVVLTAGHGTIGAEKAKVCFLTYVGQTVSSESIFEGKPITNPNYKGVPSGNGLPNYDYHDVGIVKLSTNLDIKPALLPDIGIIDTLPVKSGVDIVGYGVQWQQKGNGVSPYDSWTGSGYRYYAPSQIIDGKGALSGEFMKLTANPGQGKGGVAFGDSGGPVFKAGTNIILGINSFVTNSNCAGVTYTQRIDIADIQVG
jgi:hypothetical protein